jgi:trimeric autotransporter adhesin
MRIRHFASAFALALIAACSQGSDIASPGASAPGTPPTGGGGGGTGGTATATCPAGFATGAAIGNITTCNISGAVLTNTTLRAVSGIAYRLNGRVDVGVDVGAEGNKAGGAPAILTIEPGVTVFGASGADYIVVNRGSRIEAAGSASAPIILTSSADIARRADTDTANDTGGSNTAEWGGLVILGRAPINRCATTATPGTAACENIVEGVTNPDAVYGGATAADNSGTLRYLQVRFAGFQINTAGNELNGITMAGVGSGTSVDFVQVHNNEDDGIELFGGRVNLKHVVLTGNKDDSFDTDNGWQGNVQYMIVVQDDTIGDNIVEASSVAAGTAPLSNGKFSNFTFIGNRTNAFRLNTGTVGQYVNGVVSYGKECFRWEATAGDGVAGFIPAADPKFNSILFNCSALATSNSQTATVTAAVAADANNSTTVANTLNSKLFPGPTELARPAFNATTLDPFFTAVNYIGAFSATETPTQNWAAGWTFNLFAAAKCPTGTTDSGFKIQGTTVCRLAGIIRDDLRLTNGVFYEIDNRVDIGVDVGATGTKTGADPANLTIEAGVLLFGDSGADYLVVNRGSKIFSNGTRANPVVFTSELDLTNTQADAANATAEWGGIVVLGRAPTNRCSTTATPGSAACENIVEGVTNPDAVYGGDVVGDSSGAFNYTVVKYAGFQINTAGNELNGITMAGVGTGTTVDYVQVHNNEDDGIELFGGGVNLKHVVLTGNKDDSFDTDNGWNGAVQYMIVLQNETIGDNIVEASSVAPNTTPLSNGKISNFTFVGNRTNAFRLNTGTRGNYVNGVVNYGKQCFRWETSAGDGVAGYNAAIDPKFNSVLFDCAGGIALSTSDVAAATAAVAADANNSSTVADTLLNTFINGATERGRTAINPTTISPFFEPVTHIGAVKDAQDTWWQGWSCGLEASDPC